MQKDCFYVIADGEPYGEEHNRESPARDEAAKAIIGGAKEACVIKCIAVAKPTYEFIGEAVAGPPSA